MWSSGVRKAPATESHPQIDTRKKKSVHLQTGFILFVYIINVLVQICHQSCLKSQKNLVQKCLIYKDL